LTARRTGNVSRHKLTVTPNSTTKVDFERHIAKSIFLLNLARNRAGGLRKNAWGIHEIL
jgi:hypothetical protein